MTNKMDLAFVNRMVGITRGGAEIWDLKMAEHLEELGADVTFYVGKPLRSALPEPIEGFDVVEIPTPHLKDLAYAAPPGVGGLLSDIDSAVFCRRVVHEIQKRDHDLVQICSRPGFARYVDSIDAPVSVVMHGEPYSLWQDVLKPWGSTYEQLEQFDQVIAVGGPSETIRNRVSCSVLTVNPGVNTDIFTPPNNDSRNDKQLLFVGRFVPAKNLELLIQVFDRISDQHPDAELILVGSGPQEDWLRRMIDRYKLPPQVQFLGYVPNENLPAVYRKASVFVLSSQSEGYPITLLEAMSCGTPVIAPRVGAIEEIVDDGESGLLYPADSIDAFETALLEILSNPQRQESFSQAARSKAVEEFDWKQRRRQLWRLYKSECVSQNR